MRVLSHVCALLSLGAILLTAGCATPVKFDYKTGTDFSKYRTFALLPLPQTSPTADPGLILRVAEPARATMAAELTSKGLTQAPADQADLAVNLKGRSLPRVEVTQQGYSYPVMTRYGMVTVVENPYTTVSTTNERTLIIEILDNRTKELIWVGSLTKTSSKPVSAQELQEAIHEVLTKYPPPKAE